MEGPPPRPLTVAEAKARLRQLGDSSTHDLLAWVRDQPAAVGLAFGLGGLLLGTSREGRQTLVRLIRWLVPDRLDDWQGLLRPRR